MEQKIELEIRLRELAAQSMLEAQTEIDLLEVEKSLLASDQRMNCYASELEQLRKQLSNPSLSTDSGRGSKSTNRRSDVVGAPGLATGADRLNAGSNSASSPSFSSLSNSQSPSKLSPVSGESANSPNSLASSRHSRGYGLSNLGGQKSSTVMSAKQKVKLKRREQLMQSITSLSNINCNMVTDNRANVSLSELRIPLIWRDVDHFKGKGDYKRFAVFCLLKIDSQIYDTQLITDVDRQVTDITFDELIMFHDIEPGFELTLEVYSCVYLEQFSLSSTPRKLKEKLTSSVSRAMGRRMTSQTASAHYTKELQAYDKSYRFSKIASATFKLEDAADCVRTYDLSVVPSGAPNQQPGMRNGYSYYNTIGARADPTAHLSQAPNASTLKEADKNVLPLFGHLCCKLYVRPDVYDKCIRTGYLRIATINLTGGRLSDSTLASSGRGSESPASSSSGNGGRGSGDAINDFGGSTESATRLKSALAASTKMATLSMSSYNLYWAILRNFTLYLWQLDEHKLEKALARGEQPQLNTSYKPKFTFRIDKSTRLLRVSNSSLTLETDNCCLVLSAYGGHDLDRSQEIGAWLRAIEQHIYDSHIWGSVLKHDQYHKSRVSNNDRAYANTIASQAVKNGSDKYSLNNNIINNNNSNRNMTTGRSAETCWGNMSKTDDSCKQTISASSRTAREIVDL